MAAPETSEHTASMTKRQDDRVWPDIERVLCDGRPGLMHCPRRDFICLPQLFKNNNNFFCQHFGFNVRNVVRIHCEICHTFLIIDIGELDPTQTMSVWVLPHSRHDQNRDLRPSLPFALHASFPELGRLAAPRRIIRQTQKAIISGSRCHVAPGGAKCRPSIEARTVRALRDVI
jgi:hypothetical protein